MLSSIKIEEAQKWRKQKSKPQGCVWEKYCPENKTIQTKTRKTTNRTDVSDVNWYIPV